LKIKTNKRWHMFKIKCLNPIAEIGLENFSQKRYEIIDEYQDADAVLVRSASMHELELPMNLKAIGRAGAGVNNIPLERCSEQGIVVFNTPGANANGVKEAVLAGLLIASRNYIGGVNWIQTIKNDENIAKKVERGKKQFAGTEISGKKIGVIGLGAIGAMVANACKSLGMEVFGYDPFISVDSAWSLSKEVKRINTLDDIYASCDFITVHVPLLESTRNMINNEAISKMKDGVVILNFSRDLLINEDDMEEALINGQVKRYVTDFPNDRTAKMEGVIAIPHLGASTEESEDNCALMAVKEVKAYLQNGNIKNSVNYPNCDMGVCVYAGRLAINHKNIPNMIAQITTVCARENININDMINKSKGEWAYTLLDLGIPATEVLIKDLESIEGVVKVRKIK